MHTIIRSLVSGGGRKAYGMLTPWILKLMGAVFASGCMLLAFPGMSQAQPSVTVSNPQHGGTVTIDIFYPNVQPQPLNGPPNSKLSAIPQGQNVNDIQMPISIPANTNGHPTTALEKATLIANTINSVYGAPPNIAGAAANADGTANINLANGTLIKIEGDKTNESVLKVNIPNPPKKVAILMDWDSGLNGTDVAGNVSAFTTSFGYDGLTDTATLLYDQLSAQTLDGLASDMFGLLKLGLPLSLQSALSLELATDTISFNVPDGNTNVFMSSFTTDTGVDLSGGVYFRPVPEPATGILVGGALLALRTLGRRKIRKE